jgi:phospholipase/carboxylesterase
MAEPNVLEGAFADLKVLVPPMLRSLEGLVFLSRHLNPPEIPAAMQFAAVAEDDLRAARPRLDAWPESLTTLREGLAAAADAVLAAFEALSEAEDVRGVFRALRYLPRAEEALFPLVPALDPISRYFLDPPSRGDAELLARLDAGADSEETGVFHFDHENGARGGFSVFVPEDYDASRAWPLVMALHGGSGNGRAFLWSWLPAARSGGAILVSPTSVGDTWALRGDDPDSPNLARMLDLVSGRWRIDADRRLLTGMSDGGTFSYVSGLEPSSPFTHLAPVAAAFHPMLAAVADPGRLRGLPIHVVHGALDWMFDIELARQAERALTAAGAQVTYREIADLSHCYPREVNRDLLAWLKSPWPARHGG